MTQAVRWGVDAILTDVTKTWLELRESLRGASPDLLYTQYLSLTTVDYDKVLMRSSRLFLWTTPGYWGLVQYWWIMPFWSKLLIKWGGPFEPENWK